MRRGIYVFLKNESSNAWFVSHFVQFLRLYKKLQFFFSFLYMSKSKSNECQMQYKSLSVMSFVTNGTLRLVIDIENKL